MKGFLASIRLIKAPRHTMKWNFLGPTPCRILKVPPARTQWGSHFRLDFPALKTMTENFFKPFRYSKRKSSTLQAQGLRSSNSLRPSAFLVLTFALIPVPRIMC